MLRRLAGPLREFGLAAGLLYTLDRALQWLSPRLRLYCYELMVQPITERPLIPARLTRQLEIREIRRGDPELALMPPREQITTARFDQGAVCLGAFQKGNFIAYMWFCFRAYEEDEVRCTYVLASEHDSVFDFDFYIFPEHRMGLAFAGLWNGANAVLRSRGIRNTFSRLTRFNLASRRAHKHLGWRRVGQAMFLQAWRLEIMLATIRPFVSVTLAPGSRARLRLAAGRLPPSQSVSSTK